MAAYLHRTTVHLRGFGGARFEWFKRALFDVQGEAGEDAIDVQIHRMPKGAC